MKKPYVYQIAAILWLLCAGVINAQPWANSNNPMAVYYKEKGWPAWSDGINWTNKINMATYTNGANDFEKFENARDVLAAQGGGVLYYPTGTYDFSAHPTGPNAGRGLMLKTGVVILGDAPSTDVAAVKDSVSPGLSSLGTKFLFPFIQKPGVNGATGEVPEVWNMVGLHADATQKISDQHNVGVAWINFVGAYVYFGPDLEWSSTWGELNPSTADGSYRKARWSKASGATVSWNERIPTGQHPGDPMFGAIKDGVYRHTKGGRFVFGCRFDDCAVTDDYMELYKSRNGVRSDSVDAETYHTYRFAARLNVDGGNVFIGNNALPISNKNFYYKQKVARHNQVVAGSPFQYQTILFDYGKQGGIDVNKSLVTRAMNRCNYLTGPYAEENVVVKDNWIFNHGHKGYELAGKWMIVKENYNHRIYLTEGDNIYNLPPSDTTANYLLTLDGVQEAGVNSDNMSRAFDMAGWCVWTDGNWYQGTGSTPGNDGEGILYQTQGGVGFLSVAQTFNRQGPTGKDGYLAPWDVVTYGLFQGWNRQRGAVGVLNIFGTRIEDAVAVENYKPNGSPSPTSGLGSANVGDLSFTCPTSVPAAPSNLLAEPDSNKSCIKISWVDNASDEVAFRVDRRASGTANWVTIAYRPANVTGSNVSNFSIRDLGSTPTGCANQGALDLNPQEWYDYLAVPGAGYEYRVAAINCANDDQASTPPTPPIVFPVSLDQPVVQKWSVNLMPNPAVDAVNLLFNYFGKTAKYAVYDIHGRVLLTGSVNDIRSTVDVTSLPAGFYSVVVQDAGNSTSSRFVKQ